ncbi:hypothetical protein CWO91_16810 [Bradyrhizobium genosp. SA-3]|uniref:hypothetical protein n=1 Tax=Bradyrhizobium genosp. SA-3 TaxID=508868 RepID=UPI00102A8815|nr:hypothetical protein [Bradyrhizobium genosp. SA-3]RZN09689.1 hypothetical protein CWO91_16810 [Bradyrhizobium genosp. SA-3]
MGGAYSVAPMPVLEQPKPKRRRKPTDYSKLIVRGPRLTKTYWMLKEGFVQDIQRERAGGTRNNCYFDWQHQRRLGALLERGWIEQREGPRKGVVYRTTGEGAFAMLLAEGQFEAKRALTKP